MNDKQRNKHFMSVFYNETELIQAILKLNNLERIECNPMYSKGNFYKKGLEQPEYFYDLNPQVKRCVKCDAKELPLADNSLQSIILDPPFLFGIHGNAKHYKMSERFTIFSDFTELEECYKGILKEAHRCLKNNGTLIFKCQDYTDGKTTMTHCLVYEWAKAIGFYAKDLAVLVKPNKIYNSSVNQRHLRKVHTYFWVFQKSAVRCHSCRQKFFPKNT